MVPIPGTRDPAHMRENAAAARIELHDGTLAELDELINESSVQGARYSADRMLATDSEKD